LVASTLFSVWHTSQHCVDVEVPFGTNEGELSIMNFKVVLNFQVICFDAFDVIAI
jgi:hypothetical protein